MKFSLVVLSSPWSGQSADSAWHYASALIEQGHTLHRVFFYHEGVFNGAGFAQMPQDEESRVQRWAQLADHHGVDLVLCVASALKRGLLDDTEAQRYEQPAASVHPAFTVSGLGQLIDASVECDRLVTFGC